jgi:hypothetical protein
MFDLFTIELNPEEISAISLASLFHQSHFREALKSPFTLALVAALQARLVNGKTFEEIQKFLQDFEWRRIKKISTTNVRKKLTNMINDFNGIATTIEEIIEPGKKKHFGIKRSELNGIFTKNCRPDEIETMTENFFGKYVDCKVSDALLKEMNTLLSQLKQKKDFLNLLSSFDQANLQWTNLNDVETYLSQIILWHIEEQTRHNEEKTKGTNSKGMLLKLIHVTAGMQLGQILEESIIKDQKSFTLPNLYTFSLQIWLESRHGNGAGIPVNVRARAAPGRALN